MKQESIDYFRRRERSEREAVRNAACEQARSAHEQMATAYARLVAIEELKALRAVRGPKLVMRVRDDANFRRRRAPARTAAPASAHRA